MKKTLLTILVVALIAGCSLNDVKESKEDKIVSGTSNTNTNTNTNTTQIIPKSISLSEKEIEGMQEMWNEKEGHSADDISFYPVKAEKTSDGGINVYTFIHNGFNKQMENIKGSVKLLGVEEPIAETNFHLTEEEYGKMQPNETWLIAINFPVDSLYEEDPQLSDFSLAIDLK